MSRRLTQTPAPPYYAVIFSSRRVKNTEGYMEVATAMEELAALQPGYLGHETALNKNGHGITVSYWKDEAAIDDWKKNSRHCLAKKLGNERWYEEYELRIAKVEKAASGPREFET